MNVSGIKNRSDYKDKEDFNSTLKQILSLENADWYISCLNNLSVGKADIEILENSFIIKLKKNQKEFSFDDCEGLAPKSTIKLKDKCENEYLLCNYNEWPKYWHKT